VLAQPAERDFIHAGLFWFGEETYASNLSVIVRELIDTKKSERYKELREKFAEALEKPDVKLEGEARYDVKEVLWHNPWRYEQKELSFPRYREGKRFPVVFGKVGKGGVDRRSGLIFVRLLGIEAGEVTRQKIWEARKEVVELWRDLTEEQEVRDYLYSVHRFIETCEAGLPPGFVNEWPYLLRALGYIAPFEFKDFEGAFLLSRAGLFERKITPNEIVKRLQEEKGGLWKDLRHRYEKRGLTQEEFLQPFQKAYNKDFLEILRKDWRNTLKKIEEGKASDKAIVVFVEKEREPALAQVGYGTFLVPKKKITLYLFYEESLKPQLEDFKKGFSLLHQEVGRRFLKGVEIEIEATHPIDRLIYNLNHINEVLQNPSSGPIKHADSIEVVFSLLNFACRVQSLRRIRKVENKSPGVIMLLNTDIREENGGYTIWDYFSFIYEFFGLPVQTLNRSTIEKIANCKDPEEARKLQGIYKNLIISLLKDSKALEFDFSGFELPEDMEVYTFLEKPSAGFCYKRGEKEQKPLRHFLYEIYLLRVTGKKASIDLYYKTILLTGGLNYEKDYLLREIQEKARSEKVRFCFITAGSWEDSPLHQAIYHAERSDEIRKKSIFVEYSEFPTAYITEKVQEECMVIYSSEFRALQQRLGVTNDKLTTAIALKPAEVKGRFELAEDEGQFYHSHLQVFSTEAPGWEKETFYIQKKNLFLFTILALSLYESESFQTPYSKLGLWQKKKTLYISLRRNNYEYIMPLNAILYEMLYFVNKLPLKDSLAQRENQSA
jgi:transcriptional regulator with XRE-family HTH domain